MNLMTRVTENEMLALASQLANSIDEGAIIYLYGDLGAGKTTFTRGFLRGLGYTDKVKSPTYTLVESYELQGHPIYHFDFYRLNEAKELEHMGIREYFSTANICLIEWPEKGFPLLPQPDLACHIVFTETGREINMITHSLRGNKILQKMGKKT